MVLLLKSKKKILMELVDNPEKIHFENKEHILMRLKMPQNFYFY